MLPSLSSASYTRREQLVGVHRAASTRTESYTSAIVYGDRRTTDDKYTSRNLSRVIGRYINTAKTDFKRTPTHGRSRMQPEKAILLELLRMGTHCCSLDLVQDKEGLSAGAQPWQIGRANARKVQTLEWVGSSRGGEHCITMTSFVDVRV